MALVVEVGCPDVAATNTDRPAAELSAARLGDKSYKGNYNITHNYVETMETCMHENINSPGQSLGCPVQMANWQEHRQ